MLKLKKIKVTKPNHGMDKPISMDEEMLSYPPSFSANEKQMPEIANWKVGEKYLVLIEVEMKRMSSYDNGEKKNTDASFDVVAYKALDDNEDYDDADLEAMQGKALSS